MGFPRAAPVCAGVRNTVTPVLSCPPVVITLNKIEQKWQLCCCVCVCNCGGWFWTWWTRKLGYCFLMTNYRANIRWAGLQPQQAAMCRCYARWSIFMLLCVYLLCSCPMGLGFDVNCSRAGLQCGDGLLVACGTRWNDANNLLLDTWKTHIETSLKKKKKVFLSPNSADRLYCIFPCSITPDSASN